MSSKLAINGGPKAVTEKGSLWPRVGDDEIRAVQKALEKSREDTRYLTACQGGGPLKEFEENFARYTGTKYAISTNAATAALHIAVMAAGVEVGDEVISPPYTWGQSVGCILHQNGIPIYADIDPKTYTLDPSCIEDRISEKTKAIIVVHLYGHPADMDPIMEIAKRHNLIVIEDCAQADGATYKGKKVGSLGHIGCFSIGDGKNLIGGEGGLVLTNDQDIFEKALLMGMHPIRSAIEIKKEEARKWMDCLGYTYRMHPLAAVIANVQLPHLDEWNEQRRENAHYLSQRLAEIKGIDPPYESKDCRHVFHQYAPTYIPEELDSLPKDKYLEALQAEGVPIASYVDIPIYLRHSHREKRFLYGKNFPWSSKFSRQDIAYKEGDCPVAEERCKKVELNLNSTSWLGNQTKLLDQYVAGFQKVVDNLEEVKKIEETEYSRFRKKDRWTWRPLGRDVWGGDQPGATP